MKEKIRISDIEENIDIPSIGIKQDELGKFLEEAREKYDMFREKKKKRKLF